ncbi:hypothetical protein OAZ81_03965 [Pseudomonadota bacterium]|nr:hypothetical protein [Pseudomonadota bacterium]
MKTVNFNNLLIISFICFFFLGCSSTQLVDISKDEQLNDLLDNIGQVELRINANEEVKQLIIKSIVSLDSDIKINFVDSIDNGVLPISNNFLNQEFAYFCKPANVYLEEVTEQYLFDFQKNDEVFIFFSERFKSQAETIKNNYPGVRIFKLEGNYDDLVKRVFELSGSNNRGDLINRLVQEEDIGFVPRPREDFEKIYIIADYDQSKNFIPSLRFNYIFGKEIYVSSQSVTRIEDRKKLLDFSEVILAVPNSFLKENESLNLDELSKLSFLQDLILISAIKKNNGNSQIIAGQFANIRFSQNTCSDMQTNLVKIDNLGFSQL